MNRSPAADDSLHLNLDKEKDFISTTGRTLDSPDMEKLESDFHLIRDTIRKTSPRSASSGASSSEVFSSLSPKPYAKRPKSCRTSPPNSSHLKSALHLSSIPLPVKSSGPIKIQSLVKNTQSSSRTTSQSVSRTSTVLSRHTLEKQFLHKNKEYMKMRTDLLEKQRPVLEMYQKLVKIKKQLEKLGKLVTLEDLKFIPFTECKQPLKIEGGGEDVPTEVITEMKKSVSEIPRTLEEVCRNLLSRRNLIINFLESIVTSGVDTSALSERIETLKTEGQNLQESLDGIIAEHQEKIDRLVDNWKALLSMKQTNNKVSDLENQLKEQERLTQESQQTIKELKKKLDEKRGSHDTSIAELTGTINSMKTYIQKLEHDLEVERKNSAEVKTRHITNVQSVKTMRAKVTSLEETKKMYEATNTELQQKIKNLEDQFKLKEAQWHKDRNEMNRKLKHQDSILNKLSTDKTEFETTIEALEEEKLTTEEQLRNTIEDLNEQLKNQQDELERIKIEKEDALGKCAAFEGYIARIGLECKEEMNKVCSSIEWGNIKNPATPEMEHYMTDMASELRIRELEDKIRKMQDERIHHVKEMVEIEEQKNSEPTEVKKQLYKQQECITKYQLLLEESENKLKEKSTEVANLRSEITQLKVRQEALEEQNYSCPTEQLQKMVEEGRQKLNELMRKSIESEQKLEHYAHVIERQTHQMSEMENLLRYRENMAGVLKASRDELVLEKESLTRYSQEMRTVLAEVTKEGKMKDRLIKELQDKIDLRERQISKLEKEVRELEANLMLTNEKRFKLQETIGSMEKELQSTKAHINQLADINSRNGRQKLKPF